MTNRDKLIDIIEEVEGQYNNDYPSIEQMADGMLARGVTVREWIPVTERLPDWRDGKVLVFTKYGFSVCERTVNGRWQGQHANRITHWMPLPKPPMED